MIKYQSEINNLHFFVDFARKTAVKEGFDGSHLNQIELAVEESIVNIIDYSFPETTGEIGMDCEIRNNSICFIISDNGIPFNPLDKEDPDIEASIEDRQVGGLGIFLIKNMMDEVYYERKDDKNLLRLVKTKLSE
jgi:serine/threonine-protein kinase RsbW